MPKDKRQLLLCSPVAAVFFLTTTAVSAGAPGDHTKVTVVTVAPEAASGELAALSLDQGLLLDVAGEKKHIATRDVIRIEVEIPAGVTPMPMVLDTTESRDEITLTLTGGDSLRGSPTEGREDAVMVTTRDLGRVLIPLETVRHIAGARAKSPGYAESAGWLTDVDGGNDDAVLLTNGDVLRGFIVGIDSEGIVIDTQMGETKVPHRLVIAARLVGTAPKPIDAPHLQVTFRESGRLTVTSLDWLDNSVELRLVDGTRISVSPKRIARIEVIGGRWEWLSDHSPISYEHVPMLGLDWEYRRNANVTGSPMVVAGKRFERGIGVHSRSSLSFELKGLYEEFVTSFGLDDNSGPLADVTAVILVDGQRRFGREHLRRGTLVGPIRLDISRANRIELIVDFGDNGDLQDRFDWLDTGLIRAE